MTENEIFIEPTPQSRAAKIESVVKEHYESGEDLETSVMDMVADTMHLCKIKKIDWMNLVCRAEYNFEEELEIDRGERNGKCNTGNLEIWSGKHQPLDSAACDSH